MYVFADEIAEFNEFAKGDIEGHLLAYYGYVSDSLKLGKGITVYGDGLNHPLVLYPVWQGDKIVGSYFLVYLNEQISGNYAGDGNAAQLNYAIGKTSPDKPLKLMKTMDGVYYSIGSDVYSMTGKPGEKVQSLKVKFDFFKTFLFAEGKSIDAKETLE